tara:strand:- start:12025 stop:12510 length:486 start_codon:yes stop_codon:yes gene_type:complete
MYITNVIPIELDYHILSYLTYSELKKLLQINYEEEGLQVLIEIMSTIITNEYIDCVDTIIMTNPRNVFPIKLLIEICDKITEEIQKIKRQDEKKKTIERLNSSINKFIDISNCSTRIDYNRVINEYYLGEILYFKFSKYINENTSKKIENWKMIMHVDTII